MSMGSEDGVSVTRCREDQLIELPGGTWGARILERCDGSRPEVKEFGGYWESRAS